MRLFGLAGRKRSGKTELLSGLLPVLIARSLRVSVVVEAHSDYDVDKPGKDSFRHRAAGAAEVMLASSHRWALMHERRKAEDPLQLSDILARMMPVDLVLAEGFRHEPHPKLELHRAADGQPLLALDDATIVAIASDGPVDGSALPLLDRADLASIADFIVCRCSLDQVSPPNAAGPAMRRTQGGGCD